MKEKVIAVVVAVALVAAGALFFGGQDGKDGRDGRDGVGASSGPDSYQRQFFYSGFESGGVATSLSSTTVDTSRTLGISDLAGIDYIELTPTIGAITITFPASTTAGFGNVLGHELGSKHVIDIYNATTTTDGASIITFACGSGCDLQGDEGETVTLNGLEVARATLIRQANSDYSLWIEIGENK